jgi:hypothetical protein
MRKKGDDGLSTVYAMVREFSERLSQFESLPKRLSKFDESLPTHLSKSESLPTLSEVLVELLNGDTLTAVSKPRVERILHLLKFQRGYVSQLATRLHSRDQVAADLYVTSLLECNFELKERLLCYKVTPQIHPAGTPPALFFLPVESSGQSLEEKAEVAAVMSALQLAQQSQIDNVRECSCGTFFVAGRIDQQHCSTKCRVKAHQSSEEFKAKRREADRNRYRLHRDGKVKETNGRKDGTQKAR